MELRDASPSEARAAARWIAAMDPWRSLGYRPAALGRWLARATATHRVRVAVDPVGRRARVLGVAVVQPGVLLGDFIALLAVRPDAAGRGIGRAMMSDIERATFPGRRWLYVSHDAANRAAARFYARLGFRAVARLPDMVAAGRTEVLRRKARP